MWIYIICGVICLVNIIFIIQAIREHNQSEIYEHSGLVIFFMLLAVGLGEAQVGDMFPDILWLEIIGFILFVPSAFLVMAPIITLERMGKSKTRASPIFAPSDATVMVDTGIYGIIRHPIYLGTAAWSAALILVFQSIPSVILGIAAIFCFWIASKEEDKFNTKKFGDSYRKYIKEVPSWNILEGLRKVRAHSHHLTAHKREFEG